MLMLHRLRPIWRRISSLRIRPLRRNRLLRKIHWRNGLMRMTPRRQRLLRIPLLLPIRPRRIPLLLRHLRRIALVRITSILLWRRHTNSVIPPIDVPRQRRHCACGGRLIGPEPLAGFVEVDNGEDDAGVGKDGADAGDDVEGEILAICLVFGGAELERGGEG